MENLEKFPTLEIFPGEGNITVFSLRMPPLSCSLRLHSGLDSGLEKAWGAAAALLLLQHGKLKVCISLVPLAGETELVELLSVRDGNTEHVRMDSSILAIEKYSCY